MPKLKRDLKVTGRWRGTSRTSEIRLSGKWLEDLGYQQGDSIKVIAFKYGMIIKKV